MSSFGGRGGGGGGGAPRVRKVMTQAINLIFEFLKNVSVNIFMVSLEIFWSSMFLQDQLQQINRSNASSLE
jgi:hypothetical protein